MKLDDELLWQLTVRRGGKTIIGQLVRETPCVVVESHDVRLTIPINTSADEAHDLLHEVRQAANRLAMGSEYHIDVTFRIKT